MSDDRRPERVVCLIPLGGRSLGGTFVAMPGEIPAWKQEVSRRVTDFRARKDDAAWRQAHGLDQIGGVPVSPPHAEERLAALFDEHLSRFPPEEQERRVAAALRPGLAPGARESGDAARRSGRVSPHARTAPSGSSRRAGQRMDSLWFALLMFALAAWVGAVLFL